MPAEFEVDNRFQKLLGRVRSVPPLDMQSVNEEREKFLAQGATYRSTVSLRNTPRLIVWINRIFFTIREKERMPMLSTLIAILISFGLFFSSAGATVFASQDSLPNEPLYPIKTWSENARLSLTESAQAKLDLILAFSDRRISEITHLYASGQNVPDKVTNRLMEELEIALQIAAGMDDPQILPALEQIRLRSEIQSHTLASLMGEGSGQQDLLVRSQDRIQEQIRLAAFGESDPQGFRLEVQNRIRQNQNLQPPFPTLMDATPQIPSVTPSCLQNSYGPGPNGDLMTTTPGQYGPGEPNPCKTPTPTGNYYVPGPGSKLGTGTPGHYGPGEPNPSKTPASTGISYGPGPAAGEITSTPGGYGPGPQASTSTCTPVLDGSGPGLGPNASQTPQTTGSGGSGTGQPIGTPRPGSAP